MHLVDACMTSVQLDQGAVGHSGTQRYETRGSGSKLADWSVKALCVRGARWWSKCAFIDARDHALCMQLTFTASTHHPFTQLASRRACYIFLCVHERAWSTGVG